MLLTSVLLFGFIGCERNTIRQVERDGQQIEDEVSQAEAVEPQIQTPKRRFEEAAEKVREIEQQIQTLRVQFHGDPSKEIAKQLEEARKALAEAQREESQAQEALAEAQGRESET